MKPVKPSKGPAVRVIRAIAALAMAGLLLGAGWYGLDAATSHPVRRVIFAGDLERLSQAELEAFARAVEAAPPGLTLQQVRQAARRIAWVRDAAVRRRHLDVVEVAFEAHVPVARWNDRGFVSDRGETFVVDYDARLPRFRGPAEAAREMVSAYPAIARALEPLADPLAELRHSPRGGWQVALESGLVLELGRGDFESRIARFVAAHPHLETQGISPRHADLRYPNGFAVRRVAKAPEKGAAR